MNNRTRIVSPPLQEIGRLRTPLGRGEQRVLDFFLEHLATEWEIYVQPHLNGVRPDFVLLNPKAGIAVFEVKDWKLGAGRYHVRQEHGRPRLKVNEGNTVIDIDERDPCRKLLHYKEMIESLFCPRMKRSAAATLITAGLIFPAVSTSEAQALLQPLLGYHRMLNDGEATTFYPVSGGDALAQGDLLTVFPEAGKKTSGLMSREYAMDLRSWLIEPASSEQQRKPLLMDARQRDLALTRTVSGFRRLRGPAGSGKSLVLAARAGQLISEGKQVLVITYNITLLHYLQDLAVRWSERSRGARKKAQWWNYHMWCKQVCCEADRLHDYDALWKNRDTPEWSLDEVLNTKLPKLVIDILEQRENSSRSYDAILVDEGQDIEPLWWHSLRKALRPGGEMLLVVDITQDIYEKSEKWTDTTMRDAGFRGGWTDMTVSYRLPASFIPYVREYATRFFPERLRILPREQEEFEYFPCFQRWVQIGGDNAVQVCASEIIRLLRHGDVTQLSVADIVLLVDKVNSGERVVQELKSSYKYHFLHTYSSNTDEARRRKHAFFMGDARLKATTIHSFKGYECRALVVLIDRYLTHPPYELLYVALTRLREDVRGSCITVVCSDNKLEEYGRTWPAFEQV
jgi:hypothetical protein